MPQRESRRGQSGSLRVKSALRASLGVAVIVGLGITGTAAAAPEDLPAPTPALGQTGGKAGTFAVETYACPPGMDLETLDPDACRPSPEPLIEWRLTSDPFDKPLMQTDADVVDGTVHWKGLPTGESFVELTAEVYFFGHGDYFIPSSDQVTRQDERTTRIFYRSDGPHDSINAYVFSRGGVATGPGLVASVHNCPPDTLLADIQVVSCDEPVASGQLRVVCGDQGAILALDRATRLDELTVASSLPPGLCSLTVRDLPDEHDRVYVFGGNQVGAFGEDEMGTDPATIDSDDDGASDFSEVRFGSDPLDAVSVPR